MPKEQTMRRIPQGWLAFGLLAATFTYCLAEELTLTTYYPSPRGVYQELRVSGNMGIGTMSPTATLDIRRDAEATDSATLNLLSGVSGGSAINLWIAAEPDRNAIRSYSDRLSFRAGGHEEVHVRDNKLGIGTTSPLVPLQVGTGASAAVGQIVAAVPSGLAGLSAVVGSAVTYVSNNGATGGIANFNYGNNTTYQMNIAGSNYLFVNPATGATQATIDASGVYSQGSDARLKTNIQGIVTSLDKLMTVQGVTYSWKDPQRGTHRQMGVIAQDVEKVFPEAVTTGPDGMKSVAYSALIAPAIEALKEQAAKIQSQEKRIGALEAELETMKQ